MPQDPGDEERQRLVAEQASRFRAELERESRSTTLVQLLDYLLARAGEPRPPKEIEIAIAVFGKSAEFDTSQDSTVRVHVHRLRQRLEMFNAGQSGPLLHIPRGEYRLLLLDAAEERGQEAGTPVMGRPDSRSNRAWAPIAAACALSAAVWTIVFLTGGSRSEAQSPLAKTSLWQPIATHRQRPLIVAGDAYMVVERGRDGKIEGLSMRPMIRSGRDLDNYLKAHPAEYDLLRDRDVHRVSAPVAIGAATILPLIASVRYDQGTADIVPASQMSQDAVDSNNVIYIEHFARLGTLRPPGLDQPHFTTGRDANEVQDMRSGRTFRARPPSDTAPDAGGPARDPYGYDYGYIASYPGPSGNQVIVISGVADAALAQMVKLVSDKRQLDLLSHRIAGAKAFEALYEVRTANGLVFDTSLVTARPLKLTKGSAS